MALPPVDMHGQRSPRERVWRGRPLSPVEEVRMFFDDQGPVPETFRKLRERLAGAGLPHIFIGAVALNAHDYRRASEDVDFCMRREDLERFRKLFVGTVYQQVAGRPRKFFDPQTQVTFDILVAGELAGNTRKQREVRFPDPDEAEIVRDTPVPSLARLVELKLVTWRYQDWGDVVNLIHVHNLDESFADRFNPLVRSAFLQCYDQKVEEDRYNPEIHDPPAEA
jgi:hypothetical protein